MGLASQPGHPGLSLPIPQWPGGSGQSHEPGVDAGLLNPSAPSPQCSRRRERGRELSAHKDPKGLFGELPWWSLDAGRWSELAVASTHGHEGRATRTFNPEGPWADLLAPGTGAPLGGGVVIKRWKREIDWLGGSICRAVEPFLFQWYKMSGRDLRGLPWSLSCRARLLSL